MSYETYKQRVNEKEYIGETHTDPSVVDEIAYACFWFQNAKLEEELYKKGIPIIMRVVNDMLDRVTDRMNMWEDFHTELLRLKEEANLQMVRDKLLKEKESDEE